MKTRVIRRTESDGTTRFVVQRFDEVDTLQQWKACRVYVSSDEAIGHAYRLANTDHVVVEFGK